GTNGYVARPLACYPRWASKRSASGEGWDPIAAAARAAEGGSRPSPGCRAKKARTVMTLQVRRVITGHDANGKAIVASDERMTGTSAPARPYISRCEIWSTDQMPVDNSEAAAAAQ